MKALVTGGAGFIGSNIAETLLSIGWEVRILDNLSTGWLSNVEALGGVDFVEGDIRDEETITRAMQGREVVFHLAASVGNKQSIENPVQDTTINALGTVRMLEAARDAGVQKIVASSSAGIYGELKDIPIREDHPVEPLTPYGVSKLFMEKQTLAYAHVYGLEAVCLRYFNVYGRNQRFDAYGNVIPIFVFNALQGRPIRIFGDGQQTRDFVNVKDVVQANISAARCKGISGAFNIASGTQLKIDALAEMVADNVQAGVGIEYTEKRLGDVLHSLADISAAGQALGFAPGVEIEDGLREYVNWASEEVSGQV